MFLRWRVRRPAPARSTSATACSATGSCWRSRPAEGLRWRGSIRRGPSFAAGVGRCSCAGTPREQWELSNPGQARPAIVYPAIHGNVAVARWTPAPRSTGLINEQWLLGATWYNAAGQVVASYQTTFAQLHQP
jgi:hypothetical protein